MDKELLQRRRRKLSWCCAAISIIALIMSYIGDWAVIRHIADQRTAGLIQIIINVLTLIVLFYWGFKISNLTANLNDLARASDDNRDKES